MVPVKTRLNFAAKEAICNRMKHIFSALNVLNSRNNFAQRRRWAWSSTLVSCAVDWQMIDILAWPYTGTSCLSKFQGGGYMLFTGLGRTVSRITLPSVLNARLGLLPRSVHSRPWAKFLTIWTSRLVNNTLHTKNKFNQSHDWRHSTLNMTTKTRKHNNEGDDNDFCSGEKDDCYGDDTDKDEDCNRNDNGNVANGLWQISPWYSRKGDTL